MIMRFPGGLRKALTLSYDDGVEQDAELIRILNAHGIRATFNINSGLFAGEGTVYPAGQIHRRMTLAQAKELYKGGPHEVAVHALTHPDLTELPAAMVTREVLLDRENLEREFGGIVRGMAYPFGTYNDGVIRCLEACGVAYCRTVQSTRRFDIPQSWLTLHPTCHHDEPQLMPLCDRFLADAAKWNSKLFYLWGHSYEFEANDNWQVIRDFAKKMGGHAEIWYATNIEVVDYVNAYRSLIVSADGGMVHNPTAMRIWVEHDEKLFEIAPGETAKIA